MEKETWPTGLDHPMLWLTPILGLTSPQLDASGTSLNQPGYTLNSARELFKKRIGCMARHLLPCELSSSQHDNTIWSIQDPRDMRKYNMIKKIKEMKIACAQKPSNQIAESKPNFTSSALKDAYDNTSCAYRATYTTTKIMVRFWRSLKDLFWSCPWKFQSYFLIILIIWKGWIFVPLNIK